MSGMDGKTFQKLDLRIHLKIMHRNFLESLLTIITKDITKTILQTKEVVILTSQKIDLIYAQSRYLYNIISNFPWHPSHEETILMAYHSINEIIGPMSHTMNEN